jgi:hypothetical protein
MKAEFLKIAGVKSEAEFYKKFPSEEAFMKKHGKAVKSLMAKKAQVGAMIPNIQTPTSNPKPVRIDEAFLYDTVAGQMGKESYAEMMKKMQAQAAATAGQQQQSGGSGGGMGGMMSMLPQLMSMFGGQGGEGGLGGGQGAGGDIAGAMSSFAMQKGGKVKKFEPHMMYDPKTKKGKMAMTYKEHLALKKKGWGHDAPKAMFGGGSGGSGGGATTGGGGGFNNFIQGASDVYNSDAVQNWGLPIISDVVGFIDQKKAQKQTLASAKQNRMLSELTLQAAKTEPEKIEREYVRPEDIQNTGEEFFPIYGVGTNVLAKNGGMFSDPGYVPLVNPNQQKSFKQGGVLGSNSYLVPKAQLGWLSPGVWSEMSKMQKGKQQIKEDPASFARLLAGDPTAATMFMENGGKTPKAQGGFDMSSISYGGGGAGNAGMQLGDLAGFNNDAGSNIGGKIGGTIGSVFGPIGSAVGGFIGSGIGDLLDRDDRRTRLENEKAKRAQEELSYTAIAPAIQAGYASHVREGGNISANPTLLDTMKMGGELKTLWGGKADTVSYNPYAGGESIEFKGNSHDYRDPKTGETGIGVAYGEQSVATNTPVVEVENEPAQKLRDGGGDENLVVYGDLKIPEEYVAEIGDDRAKGKKFKNYVSDVLNKDEAKINKKMEKAADKGLESDNTVFGQLERATADVILNGSDMKLKNIAEKKNILADLQSALNETFDELAIKGNEFITKNKIVEDPERAMNNMAKSGIEIKPENEGKFTAWAKERGMSVAEAADEVMANTDKYPPGVVKMANFAKNARKFKKAQNGIGLKQLPEEFETEAEAIAAGYVKQADGTFVKEEEILGEETIDRSAEAMENVPAGQRKQAGGFYGKVTQEEFADLQAANPWYDWENFDPSNEADVRAYQTEFNKRAKEAGSKARIKVDGKFGEQTASARYEEKKEQPKETVSRTAKVNEVTTEETTTAVPQQGLPFMGFPPPPVRGEALDPNQLLGEFAALSSNVLEPVYAQTYQPRLRVPYDISLQAAKNDVIAQNRALQRNPTLQGNPAALALAQAPTYAALNKLNETEFIANQRMKDQVYSGNLDQLNKARLVNLGIYDKQQDRQAQAVANTKATTIAALNSISSKYAQKKLENRLEQVYANLYPTYRYDDNFRTRVQQSAMFNLPGGTVSGIPGLATPGFNPALQQIPGVLGGIQSILGAQQQFNQQRGPQIKRGAINRAMKDFDPNDIYDYVDPNQMYPADAGYMPIDEGVAKKGKTVKKKNYKNSNVLKALRGL